MSEQSPTSSSQLPRRDSIRTRLVASSLGIALGLVALTVALNTILLHQVTRREAAEATRSIAMLLAHGAAAGLDFESEESVRSALAGVFEIEEVLHVSVVRPNGAPFVTLGDSGGQDCPDCSGEGADPVWKGEHLHDEVPIRSSGGQVIGTLEIGYSLLELRREVNHATILLLLLGIGLATVAAVLSNRVGRNLTRPILDLARAARAMAEGRFTEPLRSRGKDEVAIVAEAFNEMAARVESSRHEIERQNRELEQNVRERTEELHEKNLALAVQNQRVLEMSRLKSAFLANVSHELRTPLNAILALSELLRDEISGPLANPDQRKQIDMIHTSGQNLLRLINEVLDLSKIESGKMDLRYEEADPIDLLRGVAEELKPLAHSKGLGLVFRSEGRGRAWIDADRIRQVIQNLVGNAVKFTEQGEIEIRVVFDDDAEHLRVSVRDTGVGIAREDQEAIFQEFRQVEDSATRRHGGTGLGLAICKRLVGLMGGGIAVESDLGAGATFTVDIPARRVRPTARHEEAGIPAAMSHGEVPVVNHDALRETGIESRSRGCVLVVEDDDRVLEALVRYLDREGFDVHVAADGFEALRQLESRRPDLMLLDLMLPGMSGFDLLEKLTHGGGKPMVPVVVHTAKDLTPDERQALDQCVQRVFRKGVGGVRLLVEEIHRLVDDQRRLSAQPGSTEPMDRAAA